MRMIAFTIYSFAIMSFAMADPLPQGKVLISTIHSFDIHYRQKLGIICILYVQNQTVKKETRQIKEGF